MEVNYVIRHLKRNDCKELFRLTQELAEFGNSTSKLSPEILEHDSFDANPPMFSCFVAEQSDKNTLCGYAMYYPIYSGREGKAIWLEDIYVSPICRKQGVGRALFNHVSQEAYKGGFCRMDFSVYSWNPAAKFYTSLGAENISLTEEWNLWRLTKNNINALQTQK